MKKQKTKLITSIGGQALMEGIMMRGPKKTTAAIRKPDGTIILEEIHPLDWGKKHKILRLPLIRGVVNMIDSLVTGEKALMMSADKALEDDCSDQETMFKSANALWINTNAGLSPSLIVKDSFKNEVKNLYDADVQSFDFGIAQMTKVINDWAKDNTDGLIVETLVSIFNVEFCKGSRHRLDGFCLTATTRAQQHLPETK